MRWLILLPLAVTTGCGGRADETSSHLGMERAAVVTGGPAPLRVGQAGIVAVRDGARVRADDMTPVDSPDRDVYVSAKAADIIVRDGQSQNWTGIMARRYLRPLK